MRLTCIILLTLWATVAALPAADAVQKAIEELNSTDYADKKEALQVLQSAGQDSVVMPVLIQAVGDRQVGRFAVTALRARTGLSPAAKRSANSGYPKYPQEDSVAAWQAWYQAKIEAEEQKAKIEELEESAKEKEEEAEKENAATDGSAEAGESDTDDGGGQAAAGEDGEDGDGQGSAPAQSNDFGKLDRIFLKDGGILIAYVMTKRKDLQGKLTSVKIMHRGGAGEETLDASLIARIEEDVR